MSFKDNTDHLLKLLKDLVQNVKSSPEGNKILLDNPIDQVFVFERSDGAPVMLKVTRGSTEIYASSGSKPYHYPEVSVCKADTKILTDLFTGKLRIGRAYVEGFVDLRGQLLGKALLGNLIRINQEVLYPFIRDNFRHAT